MNLEVTLVSTASWGSGGNGQITIRNLGSALTSWSFSVSPQNFAISEFWQLSSSSANGVLTISPAFWNVGKSLAAGETVTSGFSYTGSSDFAATSLTPGVKVVTSSSGGGGGIIPAPIVLSLEVTLASMSSWVGGGNGMLTVKNLGSELSNWSFNLSTSNFVISELWTATKSGSGSNITVSGPSWAPKLATGATFQSGFTYTGNSAFSASTNTAGVKLSLPGSTQPVPVPIPTPTPVPIPVPTPVPTPTQTTKKVFGYFTEWSIYDRGFSVAQIPVSKLTHIVYAFMLPNPSPADFDLLSANWPFPPKPYYPSIPEGTLVAHDEYANKINIADLRKLKIDNPHVKVIISTGGWSLSWTMSKVMADPVLRKRFITSSVNFVVSNGFDGLDVDWEHAGVNGAGYNYVDPVNDPINLVTYLKELRAEFTRVSTGKYYEISAAIGANPKVLDNNRNAMPHLDHVLLMTYDYEGSWGQGGHLAGLYHNPASGNDPTFNVDATVTKVLGFGIPANKVCLGLPYYGRGWGKLIPKNPSMPIFGESVGGPAASFSGKAGEPGLSSWRHIRDMVNKSGFIRYYDPIAHAAFIHNSTTGETWSYDDPMTIAEKMKYALAKGLGGVLIWEISDDTRDGRESLLDATVTGLTVMNAQSPQI